MLNHSKTLFAVILMSALFAVPPGRAGIQRDHFGHC